MLLTLTQEVHRRTRAASLIPWIAGLGIAAAVGAVYFLASRLSLRFLAEVDSVVVFWPAAGVSVGLLIARSRDAKWPIVVGVAAATIATNLMDDRAVWRSMAFALCNSGEGLLVAWFIRRYFGLDFCFGRLRSVLGFLAATVAATAASGVGGTVAVWLLESSTAPVPIIWQHWFTAHAIGMIAVAPLVITVAKALRQPPPRGEIMEGVAALSVLLTMTIGIFSWPSSPWETMALAALVFPVVLWITARCRPVFAAAAAFGHSLAIAWAMIFKVGYFGDATLPDEDSILVARAVIVCFALCAYVLAALFAERRKHESVLEESEARLQEALTAGAVTAFEWNPRSGRSQRSENASQILGLARKEPLSSAQFIEHVHPDDRASFKSVLHEISVKSPSYSVTFRFIRPDGQEVWLEETARGEFDSAGRLIRLKGLTRDITRRKRAEERQDLLIAELDHRVKNVLARVAVVAMHTRQSNRTMDEFVMALDGRLKSMAAAHALLSQSRWCGVGLTDLIRRQLAPYTTEANTMIAGPDVMLKPAETQALAMVMHELVTNAAKYGALSCPEGRVSVNWELTGAGVSRLIITWRERGGPPVETPIQASYGSSLIRDLIPHELDGAVDLVFPYEGACCKISIPLERK